ncbi:MAG: tetratricopeptide repeat protein [Planctomycetota bacterium]|jgi:hypothetical protein
MRKIVYMFLPVVGVALAAWLNPRVLAQSPEGVSTFLGDPIEVLERGLAEFDKGQQLLATQRDRARDHFLQAAQYLESVASSGVGNGRLEYNIGNCYLQAGRLGEAILHYRRAERHIPGDPLLEDNLREARSRRLTTITPKASTSLFRGIFFLHFETSRATRFRIGIAVYLLFWIILTVRTLVRSRALSAVAVLCFAICCSVGISIAVNRWEDRNAPQGVVLGMDVAVFNGPGVSYQRRFEQPLQPGVEFTLRSRRGNWWKIDLPDGNSGWIDAEFARLIPRQV